MGNIEFSDLQVAQYRPSLTLEDGMRRCCALGGIHDFMFKDDVDEDFASALDNWDTANATGTWSIDTQRMKGVGGGTASTYYYCQYNDPITPSFAVSFTKQGTYGGISFLDNEYIVAWNGSETKIGLLNSSMVISEVLSRRQVVLVDDVEIKVVVRYHAMTNFDVLDWVSISVWQNGRCITAAADWIEDASSYGASFGMLAYESNTSYFDNINIPELHSIREWTSVDPSEPVGMGLSRVIGTTPIVYFVRHDGTFSAWVPGDRDVDWDIPEGRMTRESYSEDFFVPHRIRMVGAFYEGVDMEQSMGEEQARHLFDMPNDPNLMTEQEAYHGAIHAHRIMREEREVKSLVGPANPLVEPHDRVTYDGEDFRVRNVKLSMSKKRGGPPTADMILLVHKYIAEGS